MQMTNTSEKLVDCPSLELIQAALVWLAENAHENLGTEILLKSFVQQQAGRMEILQQDGQIVSVSIVTPTGLWFLESTQQIAAHRFVSQVHRAGWPKKITTSGKVKDWIRPLLIQNSQIVREHNLLVMTCAKAPMNRNGRWARFEDLVVLQEYQNAYNSERETSICPNWEELISKRQVAVLEFEDRIVAVVKRSGMTAQYACIGGTFTFGNYRGRGFATQVTGFVVSELLRERPFVHLVVDEDNLAAIGLYRRVGFQEIGKCYMAYLR